MLKKTARPSRRVLILWNQAEEDIYELWRRQGPKPLPWDPARLADEVSTVREEMDEFVGAVAECGYDVICINAEDDIDRLISAIRLYRPDVVFNLVEYFYDDETLDIGVIGLYELFDVAYTGSRAHALTLCQRKDHTKLILAGAGLPTAPYFVVEHKDTPIPEPVELGLQFPFIVKPVLEDASGGIDPQSVVTDYNALVARVRYVLTEFEQPALVEQYIDGREIHAALLGNDPPEVLPLFEMKFDDAELSDSAGWQPKIISYEAKWDPLSQMFYCMDPVCPATDLDPELVEKIHLIAVRAYQVTGCRDYARIDMRVDAAGQPYVLEVNPNPDLTNGSAFIMCALASGRSYAQTLGDIVELAARRGHHDRSATEAAAAGEEVAGEHVPTDLLARKYRDRG